MQEIHWERVQRFIGPDRPRLRRRIERVREVGFPDLELILQETWEEIAASARRCQSAPAVGVIAGAGVAHYTPAFSAAIYEWMSISMRERPLSYVQLICAPEMRELIKSFSRNSGMVPGALSFSLVLTYFMAAFEREGKRVYTVSPGLAEKLCHTELRGLSCEDLRLPYPAIYIEVPAKADLQIWNDETGWHRLEGVYVIEDPDVLGGADGMDFLERERVAWGLQPGELLRGWRFLLVGECKDPGNAEKMGDDAVYYYRVPLPAGLEVEEAIRKSRDNAFIGRDRDRMRSEALDPDEQWKQVFSWVMNLIMYVTWCEPGERWMLNREARQLWERAQKAPKGSAKRKRLHQEFQKFDPRWRIQLGKHILVQRHEEGPERGAGQPRGPMTVISWVAGHWKRVAYGPGRSQRRWQHIEPYRRGPEGAAEIWKPHHAE